MPDPAYDDPEEAAFLQHVFGITEYPAYDTEGTPLGVPYWDAEEGIRELMALKNLMDRQRLGRDPFGARLLRAMGEHYERQRDEERMPFDD